MADNNFLVRTGISVNTSFVANSSQVTITSTPLSANGSVGTSGYVLTSNGSIGAPYWKLISGTGTVTSVAGTGTVAGLTLSGTVTSSGSLTLGGTLSVPVTNISTTSGTPSATTFLRGDGTWQTVSAGSGTVTQVQGTGSVAGLTLTGTVTSSGSLTLGGTLAVPISSISTTSGTPSSSTYLRGDGTWSSVSTGSGTQYQLAYYATTGSALSGAPISVNSSGSLAIGAGANYTKGLNISDSSNYGGLQLGNDSSDAIYIIKESSGAGSNPSMFHIARGPGSKLMFSINTGGAFGFSPNYTYGSINYGSSGQVLTSTGAGSPPTWTGGTTVGAIGTYALLYDSSGSTNNPGTTKSASNLYYASGGGNYTSNQPVGTWQCMGISSGDGGAYNVTLWLRIS